MIRRPGTSFLVADVVKLADVRVTETGGRARLPEESLPSLGVDRLANGLDRHRALQPLVFGRIDHSHPAFADLAEDPVGADVVHAGDSN